MTLDFEKFGKRFQSHSVVALTIEVSRILITLVQRGKETTTPVPVAISATALLENPVKAGTELLAALEAAGIRERRCVVCLPPSWALLAAADMPEAVAAEDLRGYFELRAEREFSTSDLRLAYSPYSLPDGKQRATLAALPIKRVEAVEKMLETAGCRLVSLSLALDACLAKPEPTLHLLVHSDLTDVVISSGGGIAAIRSLANPDASDSTAFAREMRITLGRLPEAIRSNVRRARIVGQQGVIPREVLERMGLANILEESTATAGAAADCAECFLREQPVAFEFVVPEVNRWPAKLERFNTKRGRQIAAASAALLFLLLLFFGVNSFRESYYEKKWNGMKNTVADLDEIQQKIRKFRPWFEPGPQKLQALKSLVAAFPERGDIWTRSIQITASLEKGDGARSVQSSTISTVSVSGFARSNSVLMALHDSLSKQPGVSALQLKQIRGNNPIQFSLTYKWEPKHE